jgi:ArsR family transcriptional regulator
MTDCPGCEIAGTMAGVFRALGDVNRLKICYLLANDTTGSLGVGDLARILGISQPAVSQHVRKLAEVGIVESRKEGYRVYFSFNRERMREYRGNFEFLYHCVMEKCNQDTARKTRRGRP